MPSPALNATVDEVPVEFRHVGQRQCDGADADRGEQQPILQGAAAVVALHPVERAIDPDVMSQVVVRDLPLGTRHRPALLDIVDPDEPAWPRGLNICQVDAELSCPAPGKW